MKCSIVDDYSQKLIHLMAPHPIPTYVKLVEHSSSSYELTKCLAVLLTQVDIHQAQTLDIILLMVKGLEQPSGHFGCHFAVL